MPTRPPAWILPPSTSAVQALMFTPPGSRPRLTSALRTTGRPKRERSSRWAARITEPCTTGAEGGPEIRRSMPTVPVTRSARPSRENTSWRSRAATAKPRSRTPFSTRPLSSAGSRIRVRSDFSTLNTPASMDAIQGPRAASLEVPTLAARSFRVILNRRGPGCSRRAAISRRRPRHFALMSTSTAERSPRADTFTLPACGSRPFTSRDA